MPADDAFASAVPTSQATSSTDTTLTTPPATESTVRSGPEVISRRSAAPTRVATSWPIIAATSTTSSPNNAGSIPKCSRACSEFAYFAPSTPPPMKPANARKPTTKPCR